MLDPFSGRSQTEPCLLFVPTVKGSRICAVCRFPLSDHPPTPFFRINGTAPDSTMPGQTFAPIKKPCPFLPAPINITANRYSPIAQETEKPVLSRSETSAFSQYKKNRSSNDWSLNPECCVSPLQTEYQNDKRSYSLQKSSTFTVSGIEYKPKSTCLMHPDFELDELHTIQNDATKENGFPKRFSTASIDHIQKVCGEICDHSPVNSDLSIPERSPIPEKIIPRARNFRQILDRFQQASEQQIRQQTYSGLRLKYPGVYKADDGNSMNMAKRCKMRRSLIETSPTELNKEFHCSKLQFSPPLTISIPSLKPNRHRYALPEYWTEVKETNIDDIPSTPGLSDSSTISSSSALRPTSNPSLTVNTKQTQNSKLNGGCYRVLSTSAIEESNAKSNSSVREPSGKVFIKNVVLAAAPRSYILSPNHSKKTSETSSRRSSMTFSMPANEGTTNNSPEPPCPQTPSRSSRCFSPYSIPPPTPISVDRNRVVEETHNQMTLKHTEMLAFVSGRISEYIRKRDDTLNKEELSRLNFNDLHFKSYAPILIKGSSLFFDAFVVKKDGKNINVTVVIAPTSQYLPLSLCTRISNSNLWCPPVLAVIDENSKEIRQFLQDSELSTRMVKSFIMPRMNLLSFHSLAAHNLNKRMKTEEYERHVCFIMMQLVCALKSLQSDGVEVLSNNFREFLLAYRYTNFDHPDEIKEYPRVLLLYETIGDCIEESCKDSVGVCKYALRALCTLLHHKMDNNVPPIPHISSFSDALLKCAELLHQERSSSLTEAKNLLEYCFWIGDNTHFDTEFEAKIWLDKRRIGHVNHILHLLIENPDEMEETYERLHLQFLLSVTPRTLFQSSEALRKSFC